MAEASIYVYISTVIIIILFGYFLFSLRQRRLTLELLQRQNFRITYSTVYGLFGIFLLIIGLFLFVFPGAVLMTLTDISISYFDLPEPDLSMIGPENLWLVNSTYSILEGVKIQSLELKHSQGLAMIGIGSGIILVSIPMLLESWRHGSEIRKTMNFVIADFEEINNKLVTVINLLRNTLNDLNGNGNFIRNMIQGNVTPIVAFGTITAGIYFLRWELYSTHLREFGLTDPRLINQLHGYVLEFNRNIEPSENSLVRQVMDILNAGGPNVFQQLQTLLIQELTSNLTNYQNLYGLLHRELDQISWIPNRTWRQLI